MPKSSVATAPFTAPPDWVLLQWGLTTGRCLSEQGCSPTLVWLTGVVRSVLPRGITAAALTAFVLRNRDALEELIDEGFRAAPPQGHLLDVYPPRVGVLHRSMTLAEAEAAMRAAPQEHVVVVDLVTGLQIARFGPSMTLAHGEDPTGVTVTDGRLAGSSARSGQWVVSHNHPRCGPLSPADLGTAATMDLAGIRAVCPDGWVWWCDRPARGWPDPLTLMLLAEEASAEAYGAASAQYCRLLGLPPGIDHLIPRGLENEWQETFDRFAVAAINRQGLGLGLRVQGAGPDGAARP